jgi:hypothetical protein
VVRAVHGEHGVERSEDRIADDGIEFSHLGIGEIVVVEVFEGIALDDGDEHGQRPHLAELCHQLGPTPSVCVPHSELPGHLWVKKPGEGADRSA